MVNLDFTDRGTGGRAGAERALVLSYAAARSRLGLAALFALDDTLGGIVRAAREPMIGQMRLTWWHDALVALDTRPPPGEPVLQALARDVMPRVRGAALAAMVEGWEELIDPEPLDAARLAVFAERRGGGLFAAAGAVLVAEDDPLAAAGRGWALADLAAHVGDPATRTLAAGLAEADLAEATGQRWSRAGRPLGALAHLARMDDGAGAARVARALWHRLTGY